MHIRNVRRNLIGLRRPKEFPESIPSNLATRGRRLAGVQHEWKTIQLSLRPLEKVIAVDLLPNATLALVQQINTMGTDMLTVFLFFRKDWSKWWLEDRIMLLLSSRLNSPGPDLPITPHRRDQFNSRSNLERRAAQMARPRPAPEAQNIRYKTV